MLSSVLTKQQDEQKAMDQLNALVEGLREKIRLELDQPAEVPVISALPESENATHATALSENAQDVGESHLKKATTSAEPSTPPKSSYRDSSSPGQLQHSLSADSTSVELGLTPRTPGYPPGALIEVDGNSHRYIDSPAHSCPMPSNAALDHPYIDGAPAGLPRYRVNSDEDLYGFGWAGALGCGSTLFGERLLEPPTGGNNESLALSFDENSLLNDPSTRQRAAALAAAATADSLGATPQPAGSIGSNDSPIRSGGSFDGVNFRTGMSGHRGVSAAPRRRNNMSSMSISSMSRPRVRMMSEHRGIAHTRNNHPNHPGANGAPGPAPLKRRTADGFAG